MLRIRLLRLTAGMSERDLAAPIGVSTTTLQTAENRSTSAHLAENLTVNQLRLLADALGTSPADLLLPAPGRQPDPPVDASTLGALLAHLAPRFAMREDLCEALHWTLPRLREAEGALTEALPALGQRVVQGGTRNAGIRVAPADAGDSPAARALDVARRDAKGLHRAQAVVLWRITTGQFNLRSTTNLYRTFYAGLLKQGLVHVPEDGTPQPSEAVLDALDF